MHKAIIKIPHMHFGGKRIHFSWHILSNGIVERQDRHKLSLWRVCRNIQLFSNFSPSDSPGEY